MITKRNVILYHVTPEKYLNKILRQGLRPKRRKGTPVDVPAIYLAASPKAAALWAIDFIEDIQDTSFEGPMAVLAVRVRAGSEVMEDPESFGEGFYVTRTIPPGDLRVVRVEWHEKLPTEEEAQLKKRYERLRESLEDFPKR